jgi:hypothetical protein
MVQTTYCVVSVGGAAAAAAPCLDLKRRRLGWSANAGWTSSADNIHANRCQVSYGRVHLEPQTAQRPVASQVQRTITTATTHFPMGTCRKRPHKSRQSSTDSVFDADEVSNALRVRIPLPASGSSVVTGYGGAEQISAGRSSCRGHYSPVTSGCSVPLPAWRKQLQQQPVHHDEQQHSGWTGSLPCSPRSPQGTPRHPVSRSARSPAGQQQQQSSQLQGEQQQPQQHQWDVADRTDTVSVLGALSHALVTTSPSEGPVPSRQVKAPLLDPAPSVRGGQPDPSHPGLGVLTAWPAPAPMTPCVTGGPGPGLLRRMGPEWPPLDSSSSLRSSIDSLRLQQLQLQVACPQPHSAVDAGTCDVRTVEVPQSWQHERITDRPASHVQFPVWQQQSLPTVPHTLLLRDPLQQQQSVERGVNHDELQLNPPETPPAQSEPAPRMQRWASSEAPSAADTGGRGGYSAARTIPALHSSGHPASTPAVLPGQAGAPAGFALGAAAGPRATCTGSAPCVGDGKGQRMVRLLLRLSPSVVVQSGTQGGWRSSASHGDQGVAAGGVYLGSAAGDGTVHAVDPGPAPGASPLVHCAPGVQPVSSDGQSVSMEAQAWSQTDQLSPTYGHRERPQLSDLVPAPADSTETPHTPVWTQCSGPAEGITAAEATSAALGADCTTAYAGSPIEGRRSVTGSPRKRRAIRGVRGQGRSAGSDRS